MAQKYISFADASLKIGVSIATIRNWVKERYLPAINGKITLCSFDNFLNDVDFEKKLISRANKTRKGFHDHEYLSEIIKEKSKLDNMAGFNISKEYEFLLSESFRNKEGIFYTPQNIVCDMLKSVKVTKNKTFLDPCCGSGNFIIEAVKKGFSLENVYGFDTDENAAAITKKRICDLTGVESKNIFNSDFLQTANLSDKKFDYIFTNPPWGKKLPKNIRENFAKIYKSQKSTDTSSLFFCASLFLLNENGKLGFLLPEAFFSISCFQDVRKIVLKYDIERFIDYGKPFEKLLTKAKAIILSNKQSENEIICEIGQKKHLRSKKTFENIPNKIFNFSIKTDESNLIDYIFSEEYITLKNNAKWGLGIVTGNNEKFVVKEKKENYIPVWRGRDITGNGLKDPTNFIPDKFEFYRQVAPLESYNAKEKLIYKFISSKLCFFVDNKQRFLLNSANFLILNEKFLLTAKQVSDYFNSNFANWLFKSVFDTHKILRGDLETIPISAKYFETNKIFDEKTYLDFLQIERIDNGKYRKIN
ncbi:MAG: N-6 DNA methylase [Chitinispirillales bacterium]|jgi:site-specific DNA-methyltransferase (adenine-specific)|nr:N-6 DNA methylase [Chitinispirillales bacterium]